MTPDIGVKDAAFWFKFLLGIVLFWLLFRFLGLAFGFMAPKAQQFGTTKLVRRFQGLCAELAVFAFFFLLPAPALMVATEQGRTSIIDSFLGKLDTNRMRYEDRQKIYEYGEQILSNPYLP